MNRDAKQVNNHKNNIALNFSKSNKFWKHIYDEDCDYINTGHNVTGLDISDLMIRQASTVPTKTRKGKLAFIQGDIEYLPFRDNTFDVILCIGVLSYLPDDNKSIQELRRVVKKNGYKNRRNGENIIYEYRRYLVWQLPGLYQKFNLRILTNH